MVELCPSSRLSDDKGVILQPGGIRWVPLFCANCHCKSSMYVIESDWDTVKNFASYLCDENAPCHHNCAAKWSPLLDVGMTPDEVFWQKVKDAQLEAFGRELQPEEIVEALKDENHILSKLAKERPKL